MTGNSGMVNAVNEKPQSNTKQRTNYKIQNIFIFHSFDSLFVVLVFIC